MGRSISASTNSNGSGSANLPMLLTKVVTGEAVTQGKIAVVSSDGLAYMAEDPSVVANAQRPIFYPTPNANSIVNPAPFSPTNAALTKFYANNSSGTTQMRGGSALGGAFLSNGNYVLAWQDLTSFAVLFAIFDQNGVQQGSITNVITLAAVADFQISVAGLSGGGFAISWASNAAPYLQFAIYSNAGAQVKAPTTVAAGITATGVKVKSAALSSGGFVLAFAASGLGNRFTIFDAVGGVVFASGAISANYYAVDVAAFSAAQGGGFAFCYNDASAGGSFVGKYSNTGAVVVAPQSIGAGTSTYVAVCVLAGGGYAAAGQVSGSGGITVAMFSPAGAQIGTTQTIGTAISNSVQPCIVPLSGGDCAAGSIGLAVGTNTVVATLSVANGAVLKTLTTTNLPYTNNSNVSISFVANKYNGLTIFAGGGGIANQMVGLDHDLNIIGTNVTMGTTAPYSSYMHYGATPPVLMLSPTSNIAVFMVTLNNNYLQIGLINTYQQRAIPVGVFTTNTAKGGAATIQYSGYINLATGFNQPYTVDARGYGGQCMNVVGNSATLYGVQNLAGNRRSIN